MATDDFTYDAETFVVGEVASGVDVQKLEADYAEMFMDALSRGPIGAAERERLDRAAQLFGLDRARLAQIEQAMEADVYARQASSGPASQTQPSLLAPTVASPISAKPVIPIGGPSEAGGISPFEEEATDPRLHALKVRIAFLEGQNAELSARCTKLEARNAVLEDRVLGLSADVDLNDVAAGRRPRPPAPDAAGPAQAAAEPKLSELDARLQKDPKNTDALHRLYRALRRAADIDRRWCVAHVLSYLGQADAEERATFEQNRRSALIQPTRALIAEDWKDLLRHPDQEELIGQIYGEIAPAVLLARIAAARAAGTLPLLDPNKKIEPQSSPMLAARAVAWSAAVLGLSPPAVYADTEFAGVVEMLFTTPLTTRLGTQALHGRSARELAFAMGRHLSWYRRESFMSVLAASIEALEDLFLAALSIGNPGLPMTADVRRRVDPVASAIEPLLEPPASLRLRACFLRFVEQGGRTNLRRWALASDRTAARAGLLLSDDLAASHAMLEIEDPALREERMNDLLVFSVSERYGALRKKLGIALSEG